jgi:hypothetical protein
MPAAMTFSTELLLETVGVPVPVDGVLELPPVLEEPEFVVPVPIVPLLTLIYRDYEET